MRKAESVCFPKAFSFSCHFGSANLCFRPKLFFSRPLNRYPHFLIPFSVMSEPTARDSSSPDFVHTPLPTTAASDPGIRPSSIASQKKDKEKKGKATKATAATLKAKPKHRQSIDTILAHVQSHLGTGTAPHVTRSLPPSIARHEQSLVPRENIKKKRSPSGFAPMEVETEIEDDGKKKDDEAALSEAADEKNDTESLLLEENNERPNPLSDAAMDALTELHLSLCP